MKKIYKSLFIAAALFTMSTLQAQNCYNCGTGTDGVYNASSNDSLTGGTYNFTSFTIGANDTIWVKGTQPLIIHCMGKVIINGVLDASGGNGSAGITFDTNGFGGIGVAGGMNGGNGIYSSVNGPLDGFDGIGTGFGGHGSGWSGGGGAGFAINGNSSGGAGGAAGISYGTANMVPVLGGSGGGGGSGGFSCGSGGGGAGGGIIVISACDSIIIGANGAIKSNGGNGGSDGTGNCGGGGGGSGGSIWLSATVIYNNGAIEADSGMGGASTIGYSPYYGVGANGAEGRIRTDANTFTGTGTISPAAGYSLPPLTAIVTDSGVLCHSDSTGQAVAIASGGVGTYTYSWSPYGGSGATANNLVSGTYTCTITDSTGCSTTVTATITQPAANVSLTMTHTDESAQNADDGSASTGVTGGTGPYTYTWAPGGQTSDTISGLSAGTYSVIVTDANGCTAMDTVTVSYPNGVVNVHTQGISVNVYPIPANDMLNIHISLPQNEGVTMEVFDVVGKRIDAVNYSAGPSTKYIYSTKQLANGTYSFRFTAGNTVINREVIVAH